MPIHRTKVTEAEALKSIMTQGKQRLKPIVKTKDVFPAIAID